MAAMSDTADLLAELLVGCGVTHAFGVTGSGISWQLITSLERIGVRFMPVAHESAAALMAGGVFRGSGQVAAAISIKGPGLANMIPGIVYNHFEGNASLSISEAYSAGVPTSRRHKRLDHAGLLKGIVKGICTLDQFEERLPVLLAAAAEEVPGPVHLDLRTGSDSDQFIAPTQPRKNADSVRLLEKIEASRRPVVVVGSLGLRRPWGKRLSLLRVPVFTTASAKGVIDERASHSAGVFTGDGKALAPEVGIFGEADLVVGLGLRNTEVLSPHVFGREAILVDETGDELGAGFDADIWAVKAASKAPDEVLDRLAAKAWGADSIAHARTRLVESILAPAWSPAICFDALNACHFDHALVLDTGLFCTLGEHLWSARPERPFLGSGNSRFMGMSIPSAIGFAVARKVPVICVVGDGGIRPYVAELKSAVDEHLPLCVILMSDGRYGSIAAVPQPRQLSTKAIDVYAPSWLAAIAGMGWQVRAVSGRDAFETAIASWSQSSPLFLEASFEPKVYADLTRELR